MVVVIRAGQPPLELQDAGHEIQEQADHQNRLKNEESVPDVGSLFGRRMLVEDLHLPLRFFLKPLHLGRRYDEFDIRRAFKLQLIGFCVEVPELFPPLYLRKRNE